MESRSVRCRAVALVAAYAVALQALLSAIVPFDLAALTSPISVLCTHDQTDGTSHPLQHDLPCAAVCAALGHGIAGPVPPDIVIARTEPLAIAPLSPAGDWIAPRVAVRGPQAPRGPPLA